MLSIASMSATAMTVVPPTSGSTFAKTLPGITAPFGYFVRLARAHPCKCMRVRACIDGSLELCARACVCAHVLTGASCFACALQDPLGLLEDQTSEEILRFRESELAHGRVAMVAALGFLVQENFHPIFPDVSGPGARQLDIVLQTENGQAAGATMLFCIWLSEIGRARIGWEDPETAMQTLKADYTPGDLGFDPLGVGPKTDADMLQMKNKELNNGRLAMMAVAGIVAQEVVTGTELLGSA